jgi:hypothetical protein
LTIVFVAVVKGDGVTGTGGGRPGGGRITKCTVDGGTVCHLVNIGKSLPYGGLRMWMIYLGVALAVAFKVESSLPRGDYSSLNYAEECKTKPAECCRLHVERGFEV